MILPRIVNVTKKPVTVQAVQFDGTAENGQAILEWMGNFSQMHAGHFRTDVGKTGGALFIPSPNGVMRADAGDWIIRGLSGHFYPCKADEFARLYEVVP